MILTPLTSSLAVRSGSDDPVWLDFVTALLQTDPDRRPTAVQALAHPFLATELPFEPYEMG